MTLTKKWRLQFKDKFNKQYSCLEKKQKQKIIDFFEDRVLNHYDPKSLAKPLYGQLKGLLAVSSG